MMQRNSLLAVLITIGVLVAPFSSHAVIVVPCHIDPTLPGCEPERDPIVLIPGITVSQNKQVLYEDKEDGQWKFAFGFNVYKGLIKKLEAAGYEQGQDLLIAHYDWRNPAAHNATTYLKPAIDQAKQNTGASKVDVVAHSFGGIVARAYIQSGEYANDINQLITLGSPHEGAADAYVAWEGGMFPEGWFLLMRNRVEKVEGALKKTRDQEDIRRPESFRSFFPSLRDMLPLNDFVQKDGELMPTGALVEQNIFLSSLHHTLSSIAAKGVALVTMAGTNVPTLGQIPITGERTREDTLLDRWRDGRPASLPPPLNSAEGDARVLLSSAHIGSKNITLTDAVHHKLPDEAQRWVFDTLGLKEQPSFFSTFPDKIFSIIILSPLEATIEGPSGKKLSKHQNDFGEEHAEYDDDLSDPDDPAEITIIDPPDGEYKIIYTGTGEGEYTVITTYADEDETVSSIKDGTTQTGEVITQTVLFTNGTTSLINDADYKALLEEVITLAKEARRDKILKGYERANITRPATHARGDLRLYEKRLRQEREDAALARLRSYYENLSEIEHTATLLGKHNDRAKFAQDILQLVEKIRHSSPPL